MKVDILKKMDEGLASIEKKMVAEPERRKEILNTLHPKQLVAATNLLHYLTLRNEDIRLLQNSLHEMGLSSLASSENHILRQLQAIRQRLGKVYNKKEISLCTYEWSRASILDKSQMLFGKKAIEDLPHLMVTFDSSFADNYALIKNLLQNGMNVARINCAHDNEATWARMIHKLKKACQETGCTCKVYMDLAGPKIRTNILSKGKKKGRVKITEGQMVWLSEDAEGFSKKDVVISTNEQGIISKLNKGERVYIDDGLIKGVVEKIKKNCVGVRIVRIATSKKQIKAEKGINFPDSELDVLPLTEFDIASLPFVCDHADLIGYSFLRKPEDVSLLRNIMHETCEKIPGLILKIETPEAVKYLPQILLEGMKDEVFGIMIARGDLAVEIGFERMGEIQEEILWICESAHVPVVWATQVLENLNKSGIATRSEITDAGHAGQAECIMINKGLHTIEVIESLRNILKRTAEHRNKKRFTFRQLNIASRFIGGDEV